MPGLPDQDEWEGLTVPMLKMALLKRDLPSKGTKRTLVARLREASMKDQPSSGQPTLMAQPGTANIKQIASKEVGHKISSEIWECK